MFDALEKNEIDGILMDKYKVGYYLEKRNNDRFKMFDTLDAAIPYYVAIRDSDPIKEMTKEDACFERQIEGHAVSELLLNHLQPVTVSNTQSQTVTLLGDTPRILLGTKWRGQPTKKATWQDGKRVHCKYLRLSHTKP